MSDKKIFVLDTSVLAYHPQAFKDFRDNIVILPIIILEELDKIKKLPNEAGKNARVAIRLLDDISGQGDLHTGIDIENGITLKIDISGYSAVGIDPTYGDSKILGCAIAIRDQNPNQKVILVSKDINLRTRARAFGLTAQDYEKDKIQSDDMYTGCVVIKNETAGRELLNKQFIDMKEHGLELFPHQFVLFQDDKGKNICSGRLILDDVIQRVDSIEPWGLSLRNKEQLYAADLLMDPNIPLVSLIGMAGSGKAQPLDAIILTPTGFKKMGDFKVGDLVSTPNGKSAAIIGIFPQGEKDIYKITFSDGTSTECCEDHLWLTKTSVERDNKKEGKVRTTKEISQTLMYRGKKNHSIPITKPIEFEKKNLPVKPYTFGVLLGDGSFRYNLNLTSNDEEITQNVNNELNEINLKIKFNSIKKYNYPIIGANNKVKNAKKISSTDINGNEVIYNSVEDAVINFECSKSMLYKSLIKNKSYINNNWKYLDKNSTNVLVNYLKSVNLWMQKSDGKFIPNEYKYSSISDRIELLQGLLDTDGTISSSGSIEFYTTSKQLAEDARWLVESLGGTASLGIKKSYYTKDDGVKKYCKDCYRLRIVLPNEIKPFKLKRKLNRVKNRTKSYPIRYITNIELIGKKQAQCIMIDDKDHLYMTNNCIITHNTIVSVACALDLLINKKQYDNFIIYRPIQVVGNDIGYLPGSIDDKLMPYMTPIIDAFDFLLASKGKKNGNWLDKLGPFADQVQMEAIAYIRGRSIPNSIILIDESQNLSKDEMKTILTRAGNGSKIILTGDIQQIDNNYLDATNNGLSYVVEKFKNSNLAGHITFTKGERSPLATEAALIL